MTNGASILVLSCDKNAALLNIFFRFFRENWRQCPFPVYLGMEREKVSHLNVEVLLSNHPSWSGRVRGYLEQIQSEYVLPILDDFVLEEEADQAELDRILSIMGERPDIACVSLADIYDKKNYASEFPRLVYRRRRANYLLSTQVGIWRKDVLRGLLREDENPWQTELYGSIRARRLVAYKFLCLDSDKHQPYVYNRGWLVVRGVWNGNEIKRLGLEGCADIWDGKDILYSRLMARSFLSRVRTRLGITLRQALSWIGCYI